MADQDNKQESQQWLTYLETCIDEQQDELDADSEAAYYEAVRDMLLHQGDPNEAISQAIERCYNHYMTSIDAENARWQEDDVEVKRHFEYDIFGILNSITNIVFETVRELPYPDPKNETLAQFLIRMARNIPPGCRKKVFYFYLIWIAMITKWYRMPILLLTSMVYKLVLAIHGIHLLVRD